MTSKRKQVPEGRTNILGSPFFDVFFGIDETADDYLDRILYQLSLSLEEHIRPGRWIINGQPPSPPLPATSPADTILRVTCLTMDTDSVSEKDKAEIMVLKINRLGLGVKCSKRRMEYSRRCSGWETAAK
ncbi:hypothetical protein M5K25_025476 [Dendrobium thyrsiflorum]|uniref:Uncharacterized protein n=1 Tax=Dendrobium thyrsiflorum TaxID=117978 RepID=A0ABD0U4C8_DENTH